MFAHEADYRIRDLDGFLYEDLEFGIEREIGNTEFWKFRSSATVRRDIRDLKRLRYHCDRVIEKLELAIKEREL